MDVKFLEPAQIEFWEVVDYFEDLRTGLGKDFGAEVRRAVKRIQKFPSAWPRLSGEVRRFRLNRFPYSVIYTVENEEILIVAIAHSHRKPGYWSDRVSEP